MATNFKTGIFIPYDGWNYIAKMDAPYGAWTARVSKQDRPEFFCEWGTLAFSQINGYALKAVVEYCKGMRSEIACSQVTDKQFAAEMKNPDGTNTIAYLSDSGDMKAACIQLSGHYNALPCINDRTEFDTSPLMLLCLMQLMNTQDPVVNKVQQLLDAGKEAIAQGQPISEECARYVTDAMRWGVETGKIKMALKAGGGIDLIKQDRVLNATYAGKEICGKLNVLMGRIKPKAPTDVKTFQDAKSLFATFAAQHTWPDDIQALVPTFPDNYPVMPEVVKIARRYVQSRENKRPISNILFRGVTSYGKSVGCEMVAAVLNMPLLRLTCSSTMEAQDFLSKYIPDNDNYSDIELPSFEDIAFAPEDAYEKITGVRKDNVECEDVFEEYKKALAAQSKERGSARFKLVESEYIRALKNGYICEVQEMSRIRDAGVMVSLNEYDRAGAMIPLADGSFAKRHPDALVIYTDNVGYTSCRPVDPSVMRRMDFVMDVYELTAQQVKTRVVYNTGFDDVQALDHMYKVWKTVCTYCAEHEITDGEISVTELERWAQVLTIDGIEAYKEACRECVVAKASPDRQTQEEIWEEAIELLMSASDSPAAL